ncbi:MAG: hypothetical protein LBL74_08505 [Bacteroidales bacterium]|jgi:putative pyruvate formate lyase activating enzyme|nr:hypothetical protein [Bacteroidales bacterium]
MIYTHKEQTILSNCNLCPRKCNADRLNKQLGFCKTDSRIAVASICLHKGEEPVLSNDKGICNIFFSHCNLQCIYCQNHQISHNNTPPAYMELDDVVMQITNVLKDSSNVVGFVSPSSHIVQMQAIIKALRNKGLNPAIVYNTNSYDDVDTLKTLENVVNVYLADMRYADSHLAEKFSNAKDYPAKAVSALKEMYRQKGSSLLTDVDNNIESGLIIRILCLPLMNAHTKQILRLIAEEISPNVQISLLSQYFPPFPMPFAELNNSLSQDEYDEITDYALDLGFSKIFTQELNSASVYQPDFSNDQPFNI